MSWASNLIFVQKSALHKKWPENGIICAKPGVPQIHSFSSPFLARKGARGMVERLLSSRYAMVLECWWGANPLDSEQLLAKP